MERREHLAIYGNVKIPRIYCGRCKRMTLVIGGITACCDEPITMVRKRLKKKVMIEHLNKRKLPPKKERKRILLVQGNHCLYCNKEFGTPYYYKNKHYFTKINWDHLVPFSYSRENKSNFVAACNICNHLKSDLIFETVQEVFYYVEHKRKKKGYVFAEDLPNMQEQVCP